ncbi:hypothetical protein EBZ39_01335 [bacterium]|nr:hypothetical protein [bacterium]
MGSLLKTMSLAFVTTTAADIVIVLYTRAIADKNVKMAVIMAMLIAFTRGVGLILLTDQPTQSRKWLCQLGVIAGMGFGTFLGLKLCGVN